MSGEPFFKPKNTGPNATQQPPAKLDRTVRCDLCYVMDPPYGEKGVGTPMISEYIFVRADQGPAVTIGRVTRCGNPNCEKVPVVKFYKAAKDLDIDPANVYRLVKACRGVASFKLHEVYSGELDTYPLPPAIAAMLRPEFGKPVEEQKAAPSLFDQEQAEMEVPL